MNIFLQVELLESALQGNTIACLGSGSSKVFLGLMVIKELSYQIRCLPKDGGKRSVYLAVSGGMCYLSHYIIFYLSDASIFVVLILLF